MLLLKFWWFLGYFGFNLFLSFAEFFQIFHNAVILYNTKNLINDTTESQKEKKSYFNAHFQYSQSKIASNKGAYSWNKMWSIKSLAILKCENKTSLDAVQYKWQPGSALIFRRNYFKNGWPRHFVLLFSAIASLNLFWACSSIFLPKSMLLFL